MKYLAVLCVLLGLTAVVVGAYLLAGYGALLLALGVEAVAVGLFGVPVRGNRL